MFNIHTILVNTYINTANEWLTEFPKRMNLLFQLRLSPSISYKHFLFQIRDSFGKSQPWLVSTSTHSVNGYAFKLLKVTHFQRELLLWYFIFLCIQYSLSLLIQKIDWLKNHDSDKKRWNIFSNRGNKLLIVSILIYKSITVGLNIITVLKPW